MIRPSMQRASAEKMNKGVNRLAILLGSIPALAWLIYIAVGVFAWGAPSFGLLLIFVGLSVPLFLIPFGLVHAIAWVVRGFRQ